ncbi:ImmA/IrrE family metallo-endopeptidase [Listeria monocytogenes]
MKTMIKFLTKQFKTSNPFKIAKENNILVICEPLGNIEGYYNKVNDQKFIHVNSDLSDWYMTFVVAHQLYYALVDVEYQFLIKENYNQRTEAHKFAVALLYYDFDKPRHDYSLVMA